MEVYLYQLFALLRADKYNVALLSGKVLISSTTNAHVGKLLHTFSCVMHISQGLLAKLLDAFAPLFNSESERCVSK